MGTIKSRALGMKLWLSVWAGSLALGCLLVLPSCNEPPGSEEGVALETARSFDPGQFKGKNVVFLVVDTLRADHLVFGQSSQAVAPFLNRIAREGVVFENAYSGASWTAPSMASMFTSLYPDHHGVTTGLNFFKKSLEGSSTVRLNRIPADAPTLPEIMKAAGYRTFGVADNPNVNESMGFTRGFDRFSGGSYRGAPEVNADVLQWADQIRGGESPFFLYVHYMDPHQPYHNRGGGLRRAVAPYDGKYRRKSGLYDSEISYVDSYIRQLFVELHLAQDTVVVFTADHGEEFGDHGGGGHGVQLYEELIHVPLFVAAWDRSRNPLLEGRTIDGPVSTLDILPSLRELLDLPYSDLDEGVSLAPFLAHGNDGGRPELSESRVVFSHRKEERAGRESELHAVIRGTKKLYDRGGTMAPTLVDLKLDPQEMHDLAKTDPEEYEELMKLLEAHRARPRLVEREFAGLLDLSSEDIEELGRLGYTDSDDIHEQLNPGQK